MALYVYWNLLPSRSEERGVLGVGGIPVPILQSCQDMKTIASYLERYKSSWSVKIRNTGTSKAVLRPQYSPWPYASSMFLISYM